MSDFQIVNELLKEFGSGGPIRKWDMEKRRRYAGTFGIIIADMLYITSKHAPFADVVDTAERYLEISAKASREAPETAQALYGKTDSTINKEALEVAKTLSTGLDIGSEQAFARAEIDIYLQEAGEYPSPDVFKRNADSAIRDAEELHFEQLLPKLRQYRAFLDALTQ